MAPPRPAQDSSRVLPGLPESIREPLRAIVQTALASLPLRLYRQLAARLIRPRGIDWYPGWSWAASPAQGSWLHRLRQKMWEGARKRERRIEFPIEWIDGLRIHVTLGNDLSECLFVAGSYEPNEFMLLSRLLRPGMVVLDVGANVGLYTLFAAKRVAPEGRVIALEPSEREWALLERNLALNGIDNAIALKLGAHRKAGDAVLRIAEFGHEGHNTLGAFAWDTAAIDEQPIELETLDHITRDQGLDRLDVLKIDAEGAETAVLEGAEKVLSRFRPLLLVEVLDAALRAQGSSALEVRERLRAAEYQLWRFGASGRPERLGDRDADNCNLVAVHQNRIDLLEGLKRAASPA